MKRYIKVFVALPATVFLLDLFYLTSFLPEMFSLAGGAEPKSNFIESYRQKVKVNPQLPALDWQPSQQVLDKKLTTVFLIAEDSRFYQHSGVDLRALFDAISYNFRAGRMALGASTISQQTVKNLFLSSDRSLLRKWHELLLTFSLEAILPKRTILNTYLNIAEFGPGIYGIRAASHRYFDKAPEMLRLLESIELAATLPSPKKHNPDTRTASFQKRIEKISLIVERYYQHLKETDNLSEDASLEEDFGEELEELYDAITSPHLTLPEEPIDHH